MRVKLGLKDGSRTVERRENDAFPLPQHAVAARKLWKHGTQTPIGRGHRNMPSRNGIGIPRGPASKRNKKKNPNSKSSAIKKTRRDKATDLNMSIRSL